MEVRDEGSLPGDYCTGRWDWQRSSHREREPKWTSSEQLGCVIRSPKETDFDRMAELSGQLGYPCSGSDIRARLDQMQDRTGYAVYVAEISECEVAGWLGAQVFRAVELNKCVEISGLVVDNRFRSHGIGKDSYLSSFRGAGK